MNAPNNDSRSVYRANVLWLMAVTILVSVAWLWFALNPVPLGRSIMLLESPVVHGSSDLCPGETLRFSFSTTVREPSVVDFDVTTWGHEPRRIILQRPTQRMVMAEAMTWPVDWSFTVPESYVNLRSGEFEDWQPGEYRLDAAITSVSRDTITSMMSIPFTVREGCE